LAVKKTALLLDEQLIAQAKEIMGTKTTTETIHEALLEVIRMQARARHFERLRRREGMDVDLDLLERMRRRDRSSETWGAGVGDPPR
jgi:Arc/MetJ family transcription regulator